MRRRGQDVQGHSPGPAAEPRSPCAQRRPGEDTGARPPAAGEPAAGRQAGRPTEGGSPPHQTPHQSRHCGKRRAGARREARMPTQARLGQLHLPPTTVFLDHDPQQSGAEAPESLLPAEAQDPECLPPSETASPRLRQLLKESRAPVSERLSR